MSALIAQIIKSLTHFTKINKKFVLAWHEWQMSDRIILTCKKITIKCMQNESATGPAQPSPKSRGSGQLSGLVGPS